MDNLDFLFTWELPKSRRRRRLRPDKPYIETRFDIVTSFRFNSALICQIYNCTALKADPFSLSYHLGREYDYARPYQHRKSSLYPNLASIKYRPKLGSIEILQPPLGTTGPSFACLYAQYKMGNWNSTYYLNRPKVDRGYKFKAVHKDSYQHRLQYFQQCLNKLLFKDCIINNNYSVIVFPGYIGCGFSGGDWEDYEPLIADFCVKLKCQNPDIHVCIVY